MLSCEAAGLVGTSKRALLRAAEGRKFEVLVTADQSMVKQQNNEKRQIALVVLPTTNWKRIRAAHESIAAAVQASSKGSFLEVEIPWDTQSA